MKDRFSQLHPAVNLCYFAAVIGFAMAVQHPAAQAISLVCACAYALQLTGAKGLLSLGKFCLPLAVFTLLLNPLFNHRGNTVLFVLPTGSYFTLESLLYGLSAGGLLVSVLLWFSCFNACITSDKFLFLFGKVIPGLSLVLSMTLRFIPRFIGQYRAVADAQKGLGRDMTKGSLLEKAKNAAAVLSITLTWALENAADTADSMKSRGYGGKRSRYHIYPFTRRDGLFLGLFACAGAFLILAAAGGTFAFNWFPGLWWKTPSGFDILSYVLYFALCASPILYNVWEEKKWNSLHSKI